MMDIDLFYFWRWILCVVCTVYWLVRLGQSFWNWYRYLWADARSSLMVRKYLVVQVLRLRVHRFTLEALQIVALLVLFFAVTWAHRYV